MSIKPRKSNTNMPSRSMAALDRIQTKLDALYLEITKMHGRMDVLEERLRHIPSTTQWIAGAVTMFVALSSVIVAVAQLMKP